MHDTSKKLDIPTVVAMLIIIVGVVLMIGKIVVDSEPGGIPILLILVGTGWFFVQQIRTRSHQS